MDRWPYGKRMYEQGDLNSLNEWSDDLEVTCYLMDEFFDYLWSIEGNKIRFIDRLYSDDITDDEVVQEKIKRNEAEMVFDNFEDVFKWILNQHIENLPYSDWMIERLEKDKLVIWRSYAELNNGEKRVELLWDSKEEVERYFNSLTVYTRCNYVAVFKMKSQSDHVIKDVECILEYEKGE